MENPAGATLAAVHLDQIGQIAITVDDLARAKNFYQKILGMKFLFDAGNLSFFQCGQIRLMIATPEEPTPRGGTILYYKVQDIHATYAALQAQGVVFLQPPHLVAPMPDHDLWMAFLTDPADNKIGLMCEMPKAAALDKH
jgi:methylmalonyl-CoA/ethylmalonyl-CoA epimerase